MSNSIKYSSVITPLERQIMHYVVEGYSSEEIAFALGLRLYVVRRHRESILKRVNRLGGLAKF